jgi:hypothetical protein
LGSEERCGKCLYWSHRAEAEVDEHTGYCSVHEMLKRDTSWCDQYERRTPEAEQRLMDQLYHDGAEYGAGDLDLDDF